MRYWNYNKFDIFYSAKLVYERHSENFDYDDNYQITVTRGREIIDSTLTKVRFRILITESVIVD